MRRRRSLRRGPLGDALGQAPASARRGTERFEIRVRNAGPMPLALRPAIGCLGVPMLFMVVMLSIQSVETRAIVMPVAMALIALWYGWTFAAHHRQLRGEVVVGTDGLLVHRYGRTRFLSYMDIDDMGLSRNGDSLCYTLTLHNGRTLSFETEHVYDLLEERWAAYHDALIHAEELSLTESKLANANRYADAARSGYRIQALEPEQLQAVLDDCSAPAALRAAAATAMEGDDNAGFERLRIAAEGLVAPGHKEALLRIADAEGEDRQQLIEELAEQEASLAVEANA